MAFTAGPWVWGEWNILPEDRAAQSRGEPYWTLGKAWTSSELIQGPFGRKALSPERIVWAEGYETEGTGAGDEDKALIAAAPDLYEALRLLVADVADYPAWERPCHALDVAQAALAKATTSIIEK